MCLDMHGNDKKEQVDGGCRAGRGKSAEQLSNHLHFGKLKCC